MRPAIVVSDETARIMDFSSDFVKYAKNKGIRNPFQVRQEIFTRSIKIRNNNVGISMDVPKDVDEPSSAEIETYVKMRDEYIANRIFEEIGYERFLKHISPNYIYMRTEDRFIPCKSADKQCDIFCHRFAECALQGAWKPE